MTISPTAWWQRLSRLLWPRTLVGQMVALIVVALLLAMIANVWVLSRAHQNSQMVANERFVVRQFVSLVQLLENTPPELHEKVIKAWRQPGRQFGFAPQPPIDNSGDEAAQRVLRSLQQALGQEAYRDRVRVDLQLARQQPERGERWTRGDDDYRHHRNRPHQAEAGESEGAPFWRRPPKRAFDHFSMAVQLSDGRWFVSRLAAPGISPLAAMQTLTFLLLAAVLVLLPVIWQMRRIARPLRDLAQAASDLGRGRSVAPLPLRGPQDVQDTVAAFNTMNERLDRFVSERTRMLAALSHDLRTPMTSMRLRLELMPPSEERDKLIASLEEMQQMAEATLSFVRQAGDQEALQKVDLNALLGSLCDDLAALEQPVNYADADAQTLLCRPVSLKRALRNLIENAVRYGGTADVSLKRQGNSLVVDVRDTGPGIPEAEMEAVFDPFYRLESSRNRETGGMGLGLSIARQIIHSHGGQLTLTNTHPGLKVSVSLPVQ
ncbi:MAG: HAMP domain-containing protein [Gammaproteobacteria bacterium]|nr:HAMP domain-containing protein [Gammaproteobacteria bacterium]